MTLYFAPESWVPHEPNAELLPLFVCARHVAIFLVWIAIVEVIVECLFVQSSRRVNGGRGATADPTYNFAQGYGRFAIRYTGLATALGNFEQGNAQTESTVG